MASTAKQKTETPSTVTFEQSGEGEARTEIIHVPAADNAPAMDLHRFVGKGDDEPRMNDAALASWLEFEQPRDAKKLIKRMAAAGHIKPLVLRATVARSSKSGKFLGEHVVEELWLNEEDALHVATQSQTPKAVLVRKAMIHVFVQVRRAMLPSVISPTDFKALVQRIEASEQFGRRIATELEAQRAKYKLLEERVANDVGTVTPEWVKLTITDPLERVVTFTAGEALPKSHKDHAARKRARSSARRRATNRLRNMVCWNGKGSGWLEYPRDGQLVKILTRAVATLLDEAACKVSAAVREQCEAKAREEAEARMRQLGLFPDEKKN